MSTCRAPVVGWQCLRIIATVIHLHRHVPVVDLFRPGSAHAFAPVTAGAGIYLMSSMLWTGISNPASLAAPVTIALIVLALVTAVAAFVLPLMAMRERLLDAKRALADENEAHAEAATEALYAAVEADDYETVGGIQSALDALAARREQIRRASTLPWEGRVASAFATTLLAPIAIWLITASAGRLLGF